MNLLDGLKKKKILDILNRLNYLPIEDGKEVTFVNGNLVLIDKEG
jgi:hypothetical protein